MCGEVEMNINEARRASYEANKREMFDGMRAYHESEINHSRHAITILLAIAGAAGAIVLAVLFPEKTSEHLTEIAWGLAIVVAVLSLTVAFTTHLKIGSDHETYKAYGREYVLTSQLLGFFEEVEIEGDKTRLKANRNIGQGKGYRKTQIIIWAFAFEITLLTFLFALFSDYFLNTSDILVETPSIISYSETCG
jgi:hypothetical protein